MLKIRAEQLATFQEQRLERLVADLAATIRKHWLLDLEDELRRRVRRHVDRALQLGLESEGEVLRFLNVALALGDDFLENDAYPEVLQVLASPRTPSEKLERWVAFAARELRRLGA